MKIEDILQFDEKIAFHNYAHPQAHNLGKLDTYHNHGQSLEILKALYEHRIQCVEEEVSEMRKLLFELLKGRI